MENAGCLHGSTNSILGTNYANLLHAVTRLYFFFAFLKRAGQDLAQTNTVMNVKKTKNLENIFTCREMLMLAMLTVVVQLEKEDWKT